jgi:hypothetical protein
MTSETGGDDGTPFDPEPATGNGDEETSSFGDAATPVQAPAAEAAAPPAAPPPPPPFAPPPADDRPDAPSWPPPAAPPAFEPPPMPPPHPMGAVAPLPILVEMPERAKQRRWTVLIRFILLIPLAVVFLLVAIATFFCGIVGWFAALFTGRAPEFLRSIVAVFIRLQLRLDAYSYLLTDRFPPFSFEEAPDYRVALSLPPATTLNRVAVAFRLILALPALVLMTLLQYGTQAISVVGWFAALITGWLPTPFHDAFRAFARYQARVAAYFYFLVPTYPGGLFGETEPPAFGAVPAAPTFPAAPAPSAADAAPFQIAAPPTAPTRDPWRIVLGQGAKATLVVAIVLGIPLFIGNQVLVNRHGSHSDHQALVQANNQLVGDFNQYASTAKGCTSVACIEAADEVLSLQLGDFVRVAQSAGNSGVNADALSQMTDAAANAQRAMDAVANGGSSLSSYRAAAQRAQVAQALDNLAQAQTRFSTALNNS